MKKLGILLLLCSLGTFTLSGCGGDDTTTTDPAPVENGDPVNGDPANPADGGY